MTPRALRILVLSLLATGVVAAGSWRIYLDQKEMEAAAPNYTLLEPGLYMGGRADAPPPETGAVLCLSMEKDAYAADVYQWEPIPDATPAPSLEWLREQVMFVDAQRKAGRTVYVHCDAGISRSGMVIVAYYMWREHWKVEQALEFVRVKRNRVNPNGSFVELLHAWEQSLAGQNAAT